MRFSKEHCWIEKKENSVLIGITDFAANRICESFELFLCDEDDIVHSGESIGEIISCEFFDIISPVSGRVIWINEEILDNPSLLRQNPFDSPLCEMTEVAFTSPLLSEREYLIYIKNNS